MKTFKTFNNEAKTEKSEENMDILETKKAITDVFKKEFPDSWFELSNGSLASKSLYIRFTVGAKSDWENGIIQNDPFFTVIVLHPGKDGKWSAELSAGNRLIVDTRPTPSTTVKLGWRNKSGSFEAILKHLKDHLSRIKEAIKTHKDVLKPYLAKKI